MMVNKKLFFVGLFLVFVLVLGGCGGDKIKTYTLTVTGDHGTVTKNPDKEIYNENEEVVLTAVAAEGYTFSNWQGSGLTEETQNPLTVVMTGDLAIQAVFTPVVIFDLSKSSVTMGVGDTTSLTVTTTEDNDTISVISSDATVATAEVDGLKVNITAVAIGNATITVTNASGKTATCAVTVQAMGGTGTEADPYVIDTFEKLELVGDEAQGYGLDAYYVLTADIDASPTCELVNDQYVYNNGNGWSPIGTIDKPFTGTFDGNYHQIKSLGVFRNESFLGLFGATGEESVIKEVRMVTCRVTGNDWHIDRGENQNVGGLVGTNFGSIIECSFEGMDVFGGKYVGGLVGSNYGTITKSFSSAYVACGDEVVNPGFVGGLVGFNNGTIEYCYSYNFGDYSKITGPKYVGGLVGFSGTSSIKYSYSRATVENVGLNLGGFIGFVGTDPAPTLVDNYWYTDVTGQASSAGEGENLTGLTSNQKTAEHFASSWSEADSPWVFDETGTNYPTLDWENK